MVTVMTGGHIIITVNLMVTVMTGSYHYNSKPNGDGDAGVISL